MDVIKNKIFFLASFTILIGAVTVYLALQELTLGSAESFAFWVAFSITAAASCLLILENERMEAAKLISENQILHICAAKIMDGGKSGRSGSDVEVFVSCFGILLNDKIIKFNQDRIQLRDIEIEQNHIVLTYGARQKNRTVRLIHGGMDAEETSRIVKRFHYETGIIPKVIKEEEAIG